MQHQMAEMMRSQSKGSTVTPPPKIRAPSPQKPPEVPDSPTTSESKPAATKKPESKRGKEIIPPPEKPAPATEAAKLNRLRRLCEKKPSGRCNVPPEVHDRWKNHIDQRAAVIEELDRCNWSKDCKLNLRSVSRQTY